MKILVATDGSTHSLRAAKYAAKLVVGGAISDMLIGSVAQRVLATAKIPALLVK